MSKSYIVRQIINELLRRKNPLDAELDFYATGEQLRSKRLQYDNLTQEMLSDIICELCVKPASKNAISAWEMGKKRPSLDHLVFLAWLYDCSIDELLVRCEGSDPHGAGAARPLFLLFFPTPAGVGRCKTGVTPHKRNDIRVVALSGRATRFFYALFYIFFIYHLLITTTNFSGMRFEKFYGSATIKSTGRVATISSGEPLVCGHQFQTWYSKRDNCPPFHLSLAHLRKEPSS